MSLKSKSFLISQGRIRNVFLTKMDALLPAAEYQISLPELLPLYQPATFRIYVDTPSEYATVPMLWSRVSLILAYIDLSREPIYM